MPANRQETGAKRPRGPGRWPKGVSGNPAGRPKKAIIFSRLVQDFLATVPDGADRSRALQVLEVLFRAALDGNVMAAREILDRGYGKPTQPIEHDMTNVAERIAEEVGVSKEELMRRAAELRERAELRLVK